MGQVLFGFSPVVIFHLPLYRLKCVRPILHLVQLKKKTEEKKNESEHILKRKKKNTIFLKIEKLERKKKLELKQERRKMKVQ